MNEREAAQDSKPIHRKAPQKEERESAPSQQKQQVKTLETGEIESHSLKITRWLNIIIKK